MPSNNPNLLKRAYENLMGTPEQNKKAKEEIEKYKASKAKEKEKEKEKEMAKGGDVKKFKPCAGCPTPAKCKAAGKCLAKKMAKGGSASKKPVVAIMIGVGKPMPAKKKAKK